VIIILTGQPNSGKTTLAYALKKHMSCSSIIDGDELRQILDNKDYSVEGRRRNVTVASMLARLICKNNITVIVSLVNPFRDLREELKTENLLYEVKEVYLHSNRLREGKMVDYYEPPLVNYLDIDTDKHTVDESVNMILDYIK
jgi:adenylylsulfate kinase